MAMIFPLLGAKDIQLHLALRLSQSDQIHENQLNEENFILTVNGVRRNILKVIKKERSLNFNTDLGRNFILSFHMSEFENKIVKGISYFVIEIMNPYDSLLVMTPLGVYQINVSKNKEKMIKQISDILKKDCLQYKKKKTSTEKYLRNKIIKMKRAITDSSTGSEYGVRQILAIIQFLDSFPKEFQNFKETYIIPDAARYQRAANILGFREGNRWWIHFHQDDINEFLAYIRGNIKILSDYIYAREAGQSGKLNFLKKGLELSESFPDQQLLQTMIRSKISYNFVNFARLKADEYITGLKETKTLHRLFSEIALKSGGKYINSSNLDQGVQQINDHVDNYYELVFKFNGTIEDKAIQIKSKEIKSKIFYRDGFDKEELKSLIHYLTKEKVSISDVQTHKNRIKFTIKSFMHHKTGKFGILKVRLELFNQQNISVYKTQNTLRSSKDKVTVSVPIPVRHRGDYRITISANDLLANRQVAIDHSISLK
jgi:hypothetical protein